MRTLDATLRCKCVVLLFLLIAISSQAIAQTKPASFADLLGWIKTDEPTEDIKSWINQRKLDFEPTKDRLNEIKKEWENIKLEDLPEDVEKCIKDNFLPPQPPPQPPPAKAILTVECNAQCKLSLDGKPLGSASPGKPFTTTDLKPGRLTLLATAKGYKEEKRPIKLDAGSQRSEFFELEPEKLAGSINVTCDPDCDIYLDGIKKGTTNQNLLLLSDLSPREYQIEAKKEGYKNQPRKVTVVADKIQPAAFKLRPDLSDQIPQIVDGMIGYFEREKGKSALQESNGYIAEGNIIDGEKAIKIKITVNGPRVDFSNAGEYAARLAEYKSAFSIWNILSQIQIKRIRSPQELNASDIEQNQSVYISGETELPEARQQNPKEHVYKTLIAENETYRHEVTFKKVGDKNPDYIPVMLRQYNKVNSKEATFLYPINDYVIREGLPLPHKIIFYSQGMAKEFRVELAEQANKKSK